MKYLLMITLLLAGTMLVTGVIYLTNKTAETVGKSGDEGHGDLRRHAEEEDGPREVMRQEILMMKDPHLNYIPTERLAAYPQVAQRLRQARPKLITGTGGPGDPVVLGGGGLNWMERGPNNIGGRCRGIVFDASDATGNTVLAGSVGGGLWRTTDFTGPIPAWTQVGPSLMNLAITSLAQDPLDHSVFYAGTGEGYGNLDAIRGLGIYKSRDGGRTWSLLPSTTAGGAQQYDFQYVQKVAVYPNGDVYASGISARYCDFGGVLRSTDGGSSWTRVIGTYTGGGTCANAHDFFGYDIVFSPAGDIYASVADYSGQAGGKVGKIYKSPAGATVGNAGTWVDITPPSVPAQHWSRIALACSPVNNDRVYAMLQGSGNSIGGIRRTDDGGITWTNIDNNTAWCDGGDGNGADFSRGQAWYDLTLAVNPANDAIVYAGGVDIMQTANSGGSWTQMSQWSDGCAGLPYVHSDIHNITFLPGSSVTFVVGCDGGVFYTADGGSSFTARNSGLNVTQYYAGALHPVAGSDYMLAGAQDNGSHIFSGAGINAVSYASGGDGAACFIDQQDPTFQIVSYINSNYYISRNGGVSFDNTYSSNDGRFINPAGYDNAGKHLYCGSTDQHLRRIDNIVNGTLTATDITVGSNSQLQLSAVIADPNVADNVWAAFSTAYDAGAAQAPALYLIRGASTGAPVVTQVGQSTLGLAAGSYISSIDVEKGNSLHVVIASSNYGIPSVWESTDGGAGWTSLDNNGVNLPDIPVWWALIVPSTANVNTGGPDGGILLATEMGIWSTTSSNGVNTVWTENSAVMGNVSTRMLSYRPADRTVMAATHGRGVFTASLSGAALPLNFLSFTGAAGATGNDLSWSVANEYNNKGFTVERSYGYSTGFLDIGFVPAALSGFRATGGYAFTDRQADAGKSVISYRLRQTDLDGRSMYSNIVTLHREASTAMVQYMSVAGNSLYIRMGSVTGGSMRLQVFDAGGRLVMGSVIAGQSQSIDIGRLAAGVYILKLTGDDGRQFTREFRK